MSKVGCPLLSCMHFPCRNGASCVTSLRLVFKYVPLSTQLQYHLYTYVTVSTAFVRTIIYQVKLYDDLELHFALMESYNTDFRPFNIMSTVVYGRVYATADVNTVSPQAL